MTVEVLLKQKKPTLADALRKYEVQEAESNASRLLQERRQKFKRFLDSRSLSSEEDVSRSAREIKREPKSPIIKKVRQIQKANQERKRPPKQRSISLIDANEMQSRISVLQSKLSFKSSALPQIIERKSEPKELGAGDRSARRSVELTQRRQATRMDKEKRKQVDLINKLKHNIIKRQNGRYTFTSKTAPEVPPIIRSRRWQPPPHRMLVPPPERPPGMRLKSWPMVAKNVKELLENRRKSWNTSQVAREKRESSRRASSASYQPRHPPPRRHTTDGFNARKPYSRRAERRRGIGVREQQHYTPKDHKRSPVHNARHRQNQLYKQRPQINRHGLPEDYGRESYDDARRSESSLSGSPFRINLPPVGINNRQMADDYLYPFYATEEPYSFQHESHSVDTTSVTSGFEGAENYRIVALNGLKVRTSYDLRSAEIAILPRNTIVTVVERIDRRYRIVAPVHGWVSYKTTAGQIGLEAVELAGYMDSAYNSESRSRLPSHFNPSRSRTPLGSQDRSVTQSPHRVAPKKVDVEDIIGKRKEGNTMKYYCVKDGGKLEWLSSNLLPEAKIMEYEFRVSRSFGF